MNKSARLAVAAILLSDLLLSLACITFTMGIQITHDYEPGDVRMIWVDLVQELDPLYAQEVPAANADIRARCEAAGVDCTEALLPATLTEFLADPQFSQWKLDEEGEEVTRTETENMVRLRRGGPLDEFLESLKAEGDDEDLKIEVRTDSATGDTYYTIQVALEGFGEVDWEAWDSFMREPEPPKPDVIPPPEPEEEVVVEGGPALTFSGMDRILGGLLSAVPNTPGMDLQLWYYQHILRKMGFPTVLRLVLDPPGRILSHTMNGQTEGTLREADGEVVFAVDEAFLRKYIPTQPWVFRVESVVEAGTQEKPQQPAAEAMTGPTPKRYRRFRIRLLTAKSLGFIGGVYQADYELQPLDDQTGPGPRIRIRFTGMGLGFGAGYGSASFGGIEAWTEFETRHGPMSLQDFDGVKGWHTGAGAVAKSWTGAVFCTRESYWQQQARWHGAGTQIGPHAGIDWSWGRWQIVGDVVQ